VDQETDVVSATVWSCGMGVNAAALLVGLVEHGERYDLAMFADTGTNTGRGERSATYAYQPILNEYAMAHGLPPIMRVWKKLADNSPAPSLYDDCLSRKALPSIAYGRKSCSDHYKIRPQREAVENWQPAIEAWARGERVTWLIGFDAGEWHRALEYGTDKHVSRYPLVEWGWDRDDCIAAIKRAGLPVPGKSSCFFCPNMKPREIRDLSEREPEKAALAVRLEQNADITSIKGLGRTFAWVNVIKANQEQLRMFPDHQEMPCACIG